MDKQALVKEFLKKGVLISPEALQEMGKGKSPADAPKDGTGGSTALGARSAGIKCTFRAAVAPTGTIMPEDAAKVYKERFEQLRDVLLRKVDAVSIRNAAKESSSVSIVGMVREVSAGMFTIEDTTGSMQVRSDVQVKEDDVVCAKGWVRDGALVAQGVSYPDVPITKEMGCAKGKLLLSFGSPVPEGNFDVMLTPDTLKDPDGERRIDVPAWVFIEDGVGSRVSVFVYSHAAPVDKDTALSWLRRRVAGDAKDIAYGNSRVLDQVPDIFWIIGKNKPWTGNYKGVSIVSFGAGGNAVVDLETRDIKTM